MKIFRAEEYKDDRGSIFNATPDNPTLRNVMYITGVQGAIRGNHVHAKDSHYSLIVEGNVTYEWQEADGMGTRSLELMPGDVVLSEPHEPHRFIFKTKGAFIAMATEARTQESYEKDIRRIDF